MKSRGFTFLELLVTLAIAAILVTVALPSFRGTIQRHRLRSAADSLQAAIDYARAEAVLRASYVSLCASADSATCSGAATYETGWIVYAHPVATTAATDTYDATASKGMEMLRVNQGLGPVSVRGSDAAVVTFGQQGQLVPLASRTNASQPVAFVVCAVTTGTAALGQNTTTVPGTRIGVSTAGATAGTKLNTGDACTP